MSEVQMGDKVRVSREIVVDYVRADGSLASGFANYAPPIWDIEIVEKRGPQVGDVIEGEDAYESLPDGAVVRLIGGSETSLYKVAGIWKNSRGVIQREVWFPRTLVYLP